jgi:hypothetical protein
MAQWPKKRPIIHKRLDPFGRQGAIPSAFLLGPSNDLLQGVESNSAELKQSSGYACLIVS